MKLLEGTHRLDTRIWRNQAARAQEVLQALALSRGGEWRHDPPQAAFRGGITVTVTVGSHDTGAAHHATIRAADPTVPQRRWLGRITADTLATLFVILRSRLDGLLTTP